MSINPNRGGIPAELSSRLVFLVLAMLVYRIGAHIPVPGLDPMRLADIFNNPLLDFVNLFSGGALQRMTIFALGVMPYITASIIMQLLTVVSPSLEQLKKEGEAGRRKITQYTRYGTLFLSVFHAFGMAKYLASQGTVLNPGSGFLFTTTLTLVTGVMFLMWLGEQITERGVGNGISMIIFAGIVSGLPAAVGNTFEQVRQGLMQPIVLVLLVAMLAGVMGLIVFIERGQRRVTVQYPKRQQGRQMFAAQKSYMPLKINMAGVIPPIFASSIILFPATISQWFGQSSGFSWLSDIGLALSPGRPAYMVLFGLAIVFFCFFYTALVFNPRETAENLKKSGAFIPGIRPGEQTAQYIDKIMTRLTVIGAVYITSVALMPEFLRVMWQVPFYFGGTALLISVVVIMDFMAQVQAHMMPELYKSLMQKSNLRAKRKD